MNALFESYKNRLAVSDKSYAASHNGERLSESKKLVVAQMLKNTNTFLNEQFEQSAGTNRSDLGAFKKFALNLVTVSVPNLIAYDLVMVYPMTSRAGYINYMQYVAGSNKGETKIGDLFFDPFKIQSKDSNYTSSTVVEKNLTASGDGKFSLKWGPVVPGSVIITDVTSTLGAPITYIDGGDGILYTTTGSYARRYVDVKSTEEGRLAGTIGQYETVFSGTKVACGTINYASGLAFIHVLNGAEVASDTSAMNGHYAYDTTVYANIGATVAPTGATGTQITLTDHTFDVEYQYNNVVVPQNDLPLLSGRMEAIALVAKARRIAIFYSQMAAFQAKTDYGFDLGEQLAEKAVAELNYEIDTEIVKLLDKTAGAVEASLTWNKNLPIGVSKAEHYEGFTEIVYNARQLVYDKTQKWMPNYMIIASDVLPVLNFAKGWVPAGQASSYNGPYFAGTLDGLKVFVSPAMDRGRFVIGVNGNDAVTSVAVYAPYMPVVPTQLLGYADGGMSQGWSTMYALEVLNKDLIVAGAIVTEDYTSYVGGKVASAQ